MHKFLSFFRRSEQPSSREAARQRLQLVLVHDRYQIEPGMLELIKDEIITVISQHLDIDRNNVQVNFSEGDRESRLVADIPLSSKRPTRK